MTTYLRPGVFVEETLNPISASNTDTSDAFAAFIGSSSKGGPLGPVLVTSWTQYQGLYGNLRGSSDDLGYAVYSFFNNGGSQCYVSRAVNSDAVAAHLTLNDADSDGAGADTAEPCLTVTALSPGAWASDASSNNRVFITVQVNNGRFDLIVQLGSGTTLVTRETFSDLTLDPADGRYAPSIVNSSTVGSQYINITPLGTFGPDGSADTTVGNPDAITLAPLVGGSDGTGTPDLLTAMHALDSIDNVLLVNLPGVSDASLLTSVVTWAEDSLKRFVVVDAPRPSTGDDAAAVTTAAQNFVQALPSSSFAAVYGPWIWSQDPASSVTGATRLTAPGGAVLGQYSRNDVLRGVQKVPAGVNTPIRAVAPYVRFSDSQLDSLNQASYNVLRTVPGVGLCIMGGRTLDPSTFGKYINVRRTLMFLERSLSSLTRFAIFENNDSATWEMVETTLSQFLTAFWQGGGLKGTTTAEAFFVTCDATNNQPSDIAAGTVNVDVGVALETPAEFIVIRIGQYDGVVAVSETTTNESAF